MTTDQASNDFAASVVDDALTPLPASNAPFTASTHMLEFVGKGSEYFRIWIVNLLLILVTLGLYYPWAKARRLKYFHNHTLLDGHSFDFHGNPVKMFKGFVIMALLFIAYNVIGQFSAVANLLAYCAIALIAPLLLQSAFRFRARNTSWRAMRFGFSGSVKDAYRLTWPFMLPGLVPAIYFLFAGMPDEIEPTQMRAYVTLTIAVAGLYMLLLPWLFWRIKLYQNNHYHFAQDDTALKTGFGPIYKISLKALGLMIGAPLLGVLVMGLIALLVILAKHGIDFVHQLSNHITDPKSLMPNMDVSIFQLIPFLVGAIFIVIMLASFSVFPYLTSRLQNLVWTQTRTEHLVFKSNLRFRPLFLLQLKNWFLTLITIGFYAPFARIAVAKMRLNAVQVTTSLPFDEWSNNQSDRDASAVGDAGTDLFDFDVGL